MLEQPSSLIHRRNAVCTSKAFYHSRLRLTPGDAGTRHNIFFLYQKVGWPFILHGKRPNFCLSRTHILHSLLAGQLEFVRPAGASFFLGFAVTRDRLKL